MQTHAMETDTFFDYPRVGIYIHFILRSLYEAYTV